MTRAGEEFPFGDDGFLDPTGRDAELADILPVALDAIDFGPRIQDRSNVEDWRASCANRRPLSVSFIRPLFKRLFLDFCFAFGKWPSILTFDFGMSCLFSVLLREGAPR
jgi:hypothetical protein